MRKDQLEHNICSDSSKNFTIMHVNFLRSSQLRSSAVLSVLNALIKKETKNTFLRSAKEDSVNTSAIFHTCPEKMSCIMSSESTADTPFAFEAVVLTNNNVICQAIC